MQLVESVTQMQGISSQVHALGKRIGMVATSGALHGGHLVMFDQARTASDVVVVIIFLNPRQFGPNEDFARYPRTLENDLKLCEARGVDYVFAPKVEDLFPEGFSTTVIEDRRSSVLCGVSRPQYFKALATLHTLFFNIVRPAVAIYGQKDPQLTAVVRKVNEDLRFGVEIQTSVTVRDSNGLALSARNAFLNDFQRKDALTIPRALQKGQELVDAGITNIDRVLAEVTHHLGSVRRLRTIYVTAVDRDTMEPMRQIVRGRTLVCVAVWCDEVRLLDCLAL